MDRREEILARLVALAEGIGVDEVFRNVTEFPSVGTGKRYISILEGDEDGNDADPVGRGSRAPRKIVMTPPMVLHVSGPVQDIGAELNTLRSDFQDAVETDATLRDLTFNSEGVRYLGFDSDLALGREVMGRIALRYSIPYRRLPTS